MEITKNKTEEAKKYLVEKGFRYSEDDNAYIKCGKNPKHTILVTFGDFYWQVEADDIDPCRISIDLEEGEGSYEVRVPGSYDDLVTYLEENGKVHKVSVNFTFKKTFTCYSDDELEINSQIEEFVTEELDRAMNITGEGIKEVTKILKTISLVES